MNMIDDRGRVFGKVNAIDALVILLVVVLIPIAYGAYALFRTPVPAIVAIEPATLVRGQTASVTVRGRDFRPFLRAQIGTTPPAMVPLSIESPNTGQIKLPDLAPGSYDLALFDEARELVRQPAAIKVVAAQTMAEIRVRFIAAPEVLNAFRVGDADVNGGLTSEERAVLTKIDDDRQTVSVLVGGEAFPRRSFQVQQSMLTFTGTLRTPVVMTPTGWVYHDRPIKIGAPFNFESTSGFMVGSIVDVKAPTQNDSRP